MRCQLIKAVVAICLLSLTGSTADQPNWIFVSKEFKPPIVAAHVERLTKVLGALDGSEKYQVVGLTETEFQKLTLRWRADGYSSIAFTLVRAKRIYLNLDVRRFQDPLFLLKILAHEIAHSKKPEADDSKIEDETLKLYDRARKKLR